jgi:hypothetical protein
MIEVKIDASRWIPEAVQAEKLVRGKPVKCHCVLGHIAKELGLLTPYMTTHGVITAIAEALSLSSNTALYSMVGVNDTGQLSLVETQRRLVQAAQSIGIKLSFEKNPHEEMRVRKDMVL